LTGDEDRAEAVVTGWPTDEDLAFFGLERADADASLAIFGPPAERLGLRAVWHRDGDALVVSFERAEGA
jgi:hypothetical protein